MIHSVRPAACDGLLLQLLSACQPIVLFLYEAIATAGSPLETLPIENGDLPSRILDEPFPLKNSCGDRDARAMDTKHLGQKLLLEGKGVGSTLSWVWSNHRAHRCCTSCRRLHEVTCAI